MSYQALYQVSVTLLIDTSLNVGIKTLIYSEEIYDFIILAPERNVRVLELHCVHFSDESIDPGT